ncbi:MAG TPA: DUF6186 family protein [Kribbellaceae bacterium]
MSWRAVTIAGFVVLFTVAAALVAISRLWPARLARFGTAVRAASGRHVMLRGLVVFCWAWLGWHFLARNG